MGPPWPYMRKSHPN